MNGRSVDRKASTRWTVGVAATLAALAAGGCVLADPRPDPWNSPGRGPDADGFFSGVPSGATQEDTDTPPAALDMSVVAVSGSGASMVPVAVLGFSSAPGPGGVEVENLATGGGRAVGFVEGTGSFALEIDAAAGDMLVLRYLIVDAGAVTPTAGDVFIVPNAATSPVAPVDLSSVSVGPPDAGGVIVLGAGAGAATPGSIISVGNLSNAGTAQTVASLDGSFSLSLLADPGDRLTVFSTSNLDPTAATTTVRLVVP